MIVYRETPVTDPEAVAEYSRRNRDNAAKFQTAFGVRPLAIYGRTEAPEGSVPDGVVLVEFPTFDQAKAWYESEEYQQAIPFRERAADWRVVIVEGLP